MKRLSLLLIILLANISFSQKTYKASKTTISSDYNGEKVFHVKSGKPITGIVIEKYENEKIKYEKIKYEGEFLESLPSGRHRKYFENGRIKEECSYLNGQLNGEYERRYDDEKIQTKCYYKNGKKEGLYYELKKYTGDTIKKLFYVNGVLDGKAYYWVDVAEIKFSHKRDYPVYGLELIENYKLGIQEGFQLYVSGDYKIYYKDGKSIPFEIKDTSYSDNGEISTIYADYYDVRGKSIKNVYQSFSSGFITYENIKEVVNKKYVKEIKTHRYWYKNGNISEESIGQLKDDCPSCDWSSHKVNYEYEDSIVRQWFENGNLKYEKYTDSIIKEWFENGNLKYENNLKAGYEIRNYENGQIEFEIIKNDKGILNEKRYYPNRNIKYEYFKSIEGDGYEKWWDGNGVLTCEGFFDKRSNWDKKYWKGTFKTYDAERLISIEHYQEGKKSGIHKYWDKNDRLTTENDFDNGVNKEYRWNKNQLYSERTTTYKEIYNKNVKSEVVKNWWSNGENQSRNEYISFDNKQCHEGLQKNWFSNGQLEYERNYKNCKPIGVHFEYHRNGRIYSRTEYRNGEVWEKRCYNSNGDSIRCN